MSELIQDLDVLFDLYERQGSDIKSANAILSVTPIVISCLIQASVEEVYEDVVKKIGTDDQKAGCKLKNCSNPTRKKIDLLFHEFVGAPFDKSDWKIESTSVEETLKKINDVRNAAAHGRDVRAVPSKVPPTPIDVSIEEQRKWGKFAKEFKGALQARISELKSTQTR